MRKPFLRLCSLLLAAAMLFQMLPVQAFAQNASSEDADASASLPESSDAEAACIMGEIVENRTEYTKEFVMSNGLHMAAVYDNAVHYLDDGQWKEIDNTLKLANTRSGNVYTNTAGSWQVSFPQSLTENNGITISRDAYTLSFRMSGELHKPSDGAEVMAADPNAELASESEAGILNALGTEESLSLAQPAAGTDAVVHTIDREDVYADAQYEETVVDTLHSKLEYADVYDNTDIIFELNSNLVKESVVINQFDATLYGYTYLLDVGEMIPVLTDSGEIELYDAEQEHVVMRMPAPYLVDDAGEYSYDVQVMLDEMDGSYVLSYLLPQEWLADENRQWPVVLDPIVYATASTGNIRDMAVYSEIYLDHQNGILQCGNYSSWGLGRIYLKYDQLPVLSPSDVIVAANVTLFTSETSIVAPRIVEVHKVTDTWASETITWSNKPDPVDMVEDFQICETTETYYTWDITDIARGWYEGENTGMMFKVDDASEASTSDTKVQFYSSDYGVLYKPTVLIMFRNNNGLEGYWDYTSSSAGRAGTGYVNQYSGNLVWTHSDIGFGGNRMPVSVSHVYSSNDCASNLFGMGNGWRTNFNQRVYKWTNANAYGDYYVWEDADGTCHYFPYDENTKTYKDEDGMELTLTVTSTGYTITDKNGNTSDFDSNGRLCEQSNYQQTKSTIEVAYNSSGFIETVKDGAGRVYTFHYEDGLLSTISYQGTIYVSFAYDGSNLIKISDKDAAYCQYEYTENNLLYSAIDVDDYKIVYTYAKEEAGKPSRVATISEYSGETLGGVLSIEYGQNETTFTDHNGNTQIVQFNNMGNTISIQDDQGRAQYAQYAINGDIAQPAAAAESSHPKGNQLTAASKLQNTVANLINHSSFEEGSVTWYLTGTAGTYSVVTGTAYHGNKSLKLVSDAEGTNRGIYSGSYSVAAGESITFSAYVKAEAGDAYLVLGQSSTVLARSEVLPGGSGWTRLEVNYTNTASAAKTVHIRLYTKGTAYMDCMQVEKMPTASRYNLIENGDFRYTSYWSSTAGRTTQSPAAAPQLSTNVYKIAGSPTAAKHINQEVAVSGSQGDTFVLAGWAKADSVPLTDSREFSLMATFHYTDGTTHTATVRFNPCVDVWQYAASPIVAKEDYTSITIELAYDYNANTVYFDGIQLFKEAFGSSYAYDENGNITKVADIQGGETTYEYNEKGDLTSVELPDGSITEYGYDDWHNVTTATTNTGVVYTLEYDTYGNNESVTITGDGVSLTSSAEYSNSGNTLASTTDTAGNKTIYNYDPDTGVLLSVQYPEDTEQTGTAYDYDEMFRLKSSEVTTDQDQTLSAVYTYENDLLKKLATQSTEYTFSYGSFSLIGSIQAGSRTLASYTYTSRNNYLDTLAYGNGDSVKYTYDQQGRVTQQSYEDGDTVTYRYDNDGALASVTDSATGITDTYYYDFAGRLASASRRDSSGLWLNWESCYNAYGQLTGQAWTIGDSTYSETFTYNTADGSLDTFKSGTGKTLTMGYDGLRRLTSVSGGITNRRYTYVDNADGTTTTQIKTLTYPSPETPLTWTYTYDGNGNIATVTDPLQGTRTYTYDSQDQLLTETIGSTTYSYTYDNAGNLLTANNSTGSHTYTYGDSSWGDLLTAYDGEAITYDAIGNPTSYYNGTRWTFEWEHGRQLASATDGTTSISYTYDANGLRHTKTVDGVVYTYYYVGDRLVRETIGSDVVMDFFYDQAGQPYAMKYNNTMLYYILNQQGDVTRLVTAGGTSYGVYRYDAWGNILYSTNNQWLNNNPLRYRGYVYDTETTLYYLQSRYYDPELGRFINADAYASTGQGVLGNNMFAYCQNNSVNGSDPCGTCFHRLDFWNDCEKCGGKTFKNKLDDFATMVAEHQAMVREDQRMQTELQMQLVYRTTKTMIDIQVRTEQAMAEQQRMQDILVGKFVADRFSTPEKATNTINAIKWPLAIAAAYCGKAGFVEATFLLGVSAGVLEGITWVIAICNEGR